MQSMYDSYSIAVVEVGVWAVGEVAAEAEPVPVVDWQVKEIVLDAEDLESRWGYCARYQLVVCLYETQRKKASDISADGWEAVLCAGRSPND
jgi:hypothetical protein